MSEKLSGTTELLERLDDSHEFTEESSTETRRSLATRAFVLEQLEQDDEEAGGLLARGVEEATAATQQNGGIFNSKL
jgi:hypothetical protein